MMDDSRFTDSGFVKIPTDATPAEVEKLRFPIVPPPAEMHGLKVPTKKPQETL